LLLSSHLGGEERRNPLGRIDAVLTPVPALSLVVDLILLIWWTMMGGRTSGYL